MQKTVTRRYVFKRTFVSERDPEVRLHYFHPSDPPDFSEYGLPGEIQLNRLDHEKLGSPKLRKDETELKVTFSFPALDKRGLPK